MLTPLNKGAFRLNQRNERVGVLYENTNVYMKVVSQNKTLSLT